MNALIEIDHHSDVEPVYRFDQLSDGAKRTARDNHRDDDVSHDWWNFIYEEATKIADMMGFYIDVSRGRVGIRFSGFWNQGDGAHFTGSWSPPDDLSLALGKVMAHATSDEQLHDICFNLMLAAEDLQRCGYQDLSVSIRHNGSSYCHEHGVSFDFNWDDSADDYMNDIQIAVRDALRAHYDDDSCMEAIITASRSFMRWIYRQLEEEHDYLTSDGVIDERLADSDMLFDEDGNDA